MGNFASYYLFTHRNKIGWLQTARTFNKVMTAKPLVSFDGVDWDKEDEKLRTRFQRKKRKQRKKRERCLTCLKIQLAYRLIAAMAEYDEYLAFLRAASDETENEALLRSHYCVIFLDSAASRGLLVGLAEAPRMAQLQHLVRTFKDWWGLDFRDRPFDALRRTLDDWRDDVERLQGEDVPSPPTGGSDTSLGYTPDSHPDQGISASRRDHLLEHEFGGAGNFVASLDRETKDKVQNVWNSEATDKEKSEQVADLVGADNPLWMTLEGYLNLAGARHRVALQSIFGDHVSTASSSSDSSSSVKTPPSIIRRLQLAEYWMNLETSPEGGHERPPAVPPLAYPIDEGSGSSDGETADPLPPPTPQVQTVATLPEEDDEDGTDEDSEGGTTAEVPTTAGSTATGGGTTEVPTAASPTAVAGGTTEGPTAATVSPTTNDVTCTCPSPCSIM